MWDNNTPLQLLKSMPKVLEKEHLEKLQMLFEADKYKNQLISGFDLCGMYAPFCVGCDKGNKYSCAVAYINYMKAEGMDIEIAPDALGKSSENAADENVEDQAVEEQTELTDEASEAEENKPVEQPVKTKIRIAVARKKTLL